MRHLLKELARPVATIIAAAVAVFVTWWLGKDYAGPFTTIFASLMALIIAYRFTSVQANAAVRQADIAHDRLLYDAFEKRHRIYDATKSLIETVLNNSREQDFRTSDIKQYIAIIDEAPFFFPESACNIFTEMTKKTYNLIDADSKGTKTYDRKKSAALADELDEKLKSLPKLFKPVLSFPELTKEP